QSEKCFFKYFTFISFFPQLLMGPINRYDNLGKQLSQVNLYNFANIKKGLFLVLFGAMKKYCIADLLYEKISCVFDHHYASIPGLLIIFSILAYSVYQYADFSGGIDIVTGIAKMFGLDMAPNFKQPYFAITLGDFWRRWHISLGAWMKDYIFYPFAFTKRMQNLSKNLLKIKNKNLGKHLARTIPAGLGNIIVFLIVGIWHGPEMHFVIWGLYNGLIIASSDLLKPYFEKISDILKIDVKSRVFKIFQIFRTFIIVNIGWYFDRITDVKESLIYLKQSITNITQYEILLEKDYLKSIYGSLGTFMAEVNLIFISSIIVLVISILRENKIDVYEAIQQKNIAIRWGTYYLLMILIILSMSYAPGTQTFMYAQY
ncbi:MBOAT family O-acyltransferase, partial [Treponema sp.]|uniref:MBOAT family O-acyltransferase n=1 Tax=Treponema sp. TaxID=166 RepID=UPI00388D74B7